MKNNSQKIFIALIALFILISTASVNFAKNLNGKILPEIVQTGDEKFDKTFREGRELIDKEDWKQATEKFKAIVCDCPEKKYADAAFYWLAFSYKKQKMYAEMNETLNRLQTNFPNSSWADDARVMRLEQTGFVTTTIGNSSYNQIFGQAMTTSSSEKTPLDREEEIKIAAFRSLLSSDADRAIQLTEDILKPDAKASENFKIQIIRVLSSRFINGYSYSIASNSGNFAYSTGGDLASFQNGTTIVTSGNNGQSVISPPKNNSSSSNSTPKIREVLMKSYQNNSSVKIKKEIIYAFGRLNDGESNNYLFQLYNSESDKELKKTVLQSFGSSTFRFSSTSSADLRKTTLGKLLEIVKTEKDNELKMLALNSLQTMYFWSKADEKNDFVQSLLQIYDSNDNETFKASVIRSLGQSNHNEAAKKLMEIAKNDKSDKLRIAAINALQGSKNPEVVKFLEDLIK